MSEVKSSEKGQPIKYVEFGGGLGDVFNTIYNTQRYASLDSLKLDEQVTVAVISHNPHVKEIFEWHPKRRQMMVREFSYWLQEEDQARRALYGLPPRQFDPCPQRYVNFYPSPQDYPLLYELRSRGPYIILATAAGTEPSRDLPKEIREDIIDAVTGAGYKAAVVGRNYKLFGRAEHEFAQHSMVMNMIDRLTVPGTSLAVLGAEAVITCHSALCILSWHMNKPTFVAYPDYVQKRHFFKIDEHSFGKDRANTMHMEFPQYSRARVDEFIRLLRYARKPA